MVLSITCSGLLVGVRSSCRPEFPFPAYYSSSAHYLQVTVAAINTYARQTAHIAEMSNNLNIDPNVWYQISNDRFDPSEDSLRVGDTHYAIYMYTTNLTSPQQRWQIFPTADGGWNFRAQITDAGAYMTQCLASSGSECVFGSPVPQVDLVRSIRHLSRSLTSRKPNRHGTHRRLDRRHKRLHGPRPRIGHSTPLAAVLQRRRHLRHQAEHESKLPRLRQF